jgi:hypothetical protein
MPPIPAAGNRACLACGEPKPWPTSGAPAAA